MPRVVLVILIHLQKSFSQYIFLSKLVYIKVLDYNYLICPLETFWVNQIMYNNNITEHEDCTACMSSHLTKGITLKHFWIWLFSKCPARHQMCFYPKTIPPFYTPIKFQPIGDQKHSRWQQRHLSSAMVPFRHSK